MIDNDKLNHAKEIVSQHFEDWRSMIQLSHVQLAEALNLEDDVIIDNVSYNPVTKAINISVRPKDIDACISEKTRFHEVPPLMKCPCEPLVVFQKEW